MASAGEYDAVVLDVMLPDLDGFETCRRLRAEGVWLPVILLTARDSVEDRVRGLDQGADDYLTKPFSLAELSARLRALVRRGAAERPVVLEVGDLRLDPAERRVWRGDTEVELSAREHALLETFMRRPGQVLSQSQLLESAWDMGVEQRSNVVEVYVRYLREKVDRPVRRPLAGDGARAGLPVAQGRRRAVSRVPIRVRLTAAFALATAAVLIGAGLFVYVQLRADLNESVDRRLRACAQAVAAGGRWATDRRTASRGCCARGAGRRSSLGPSAAARAGEQLLFEREVAGSRAPRGCWPGPGQAGTVVVAGRSLEDRDEALAGLVAAFAIGGPVAIVLASLLGYAWPRVRCDRWRRCAAARPRCRWRTATSGCRCPRPGTRSTPSARR